MARQINKTPALIASPLIYNASIEPNIRQHRIFTVDVSNTGTADVYLTHLDNEPVKVAEGLTADSEPVTFYGAGYSQLEVRPTVDPIDATVYSAEK